MPDRKANKNCNILITQKEEIVKKCISEITKQFSEKIELISEQIFENVNKQYLEEIMTFFFFFFFFSFRPFPLFRGGQSVSSFSTCFCLQCPSPAPTSFISSFTTSENLLFGLPLLLFPGNSISIIFLPTYS